MQTERPGDDVLIRKRIGRPADDLACLMALAGDDEDISRPQSGDGAPDRALAIADFGRLGASTSRAPARMAARMAAGSSLRGLSSVTMTDVGVARGDLAHQRPLSLVAIAAAAEDDDEAPLAPVAAATCRTFSSASGLCA